jgi:hypothetical protein
LFRKLTYLETCTRLISHNFNLVTNAATGNLMSQTLPGCCMASGRTRGLQPNIVVNLYLPDQAISRSRTGSLQAGRELRQFVQVSIQTCPSYLSIIGVQIDYDVVHLRTSLVQLFVLLPLNFEEVVQIIELRRFGGAPNGYPFAAL